MGRRGPPPTPTALKIERGNPGHRPLNLDEPQFAAIAPVCPKDLKGDAAEHWNELAPELATKGLLTIASRPLFVICCQTVGDIQEWTRRIARISPAHADRIPAEIHLNKLRTQYRQYAAEFGLSPARASSVKAVKQPEPADVKRRRFFGARGNGPAS